MSRVSLLLCLCALLFCHFFAAEGLAQIVVEHPTNTQIADGGTCNIGTMAIGGNTVRTFVIRNTSASSVSGVAVTESGDPDNEFAIVTAPATTIAASGATTFAIRFTPASTGAKSVNLHVASSDVGSPYDIIVTASGIVGTVRPGFDQNVLPRTDDGSSPFTPFGFTINLFGTNYSGGYVNNNGNVTFDAPLSVYVPPSIATTATKVLAPFWGDVDTTNVASGRVKYGTGTVNGRLAWGATWEKVGYYNTTTNGVDRLNWFQVILVDRSDREPGSFDMEFNYNQIQWDTTTVGPAIARVGYSNGSDVTYEVPGSGVTGSFLDSSPGSLTVTVEGKIAFSSTSGSVTVGEAIPRGIESAWRQVYSGTDAPTILRNGDAKAVAIQKVGDTAIATVATGFITNAAGNKDIYTVKYDAVTGAKAWQVIFDGQGHGADEGAAIAVDAAGHVIVAGFITVSAGNTDIYVAKYDGATGGLLWDETFNGSANAADVATSLALTGTGDVVVGGTITNANSDIFAAKLVGSSGAVSWSSSVNGTANKADAGAGVAVDGSGAVIVAGTTVNSSNNLDAWTVKLAAANGAQVWERSYNGANKIDAATSVAVDSSGAVFISGYSQQTSYEIYLAKYDGANGNILWDRTWDSELHSSDASWTLRLDSYEEVVIAGTSYPQASVFDGYVAKHANATGAVLWNRRFNGPDNGQDQMLAVGLDLEDNVVATGYSQNTDGTYDAWTAKMLASDGGLLWSERLNGTAGKDDQARAVAVAPDGHVFIAGFSTTAANTTDFLVNRYTAVDPTETVAQTINFANPGPQSAGTPVTLAATASSGLTVRFSVVAGPAVLDENQNTKLSFTGSGSVTIRASQSGSSLISAAVPVEQTFTVSQSAQSISFALPATASYTNSVPLSAYSTSGLPISYAVVGGGPGVITGNVLSFSSPGDVTVRASQVGDARYTAATVVDRTISAVNTPPVIVPSGIELAWAAPQPGAGKATAVALQLSGNDAVAGFVTGYTTSANGKDIYLAKYDTDGTPVWQQTINGGANADDEGAAILVDAAGDVIVAGYLTVAPGDTSIRVEKRSGSTGAFIWGYTFAGSAPGVDLAIGLALEGSSNVVVGGTVTNSNAGTDFFAAKLSQTTGAEVWHSSINSMGSAADSAAGVTVGPDGSVALTGVSSSDVWTVKLASANGSLQWQQRYNPGNRQDGGRSVAIDAAGHVLVAAYVRNTTYDMYIAKYAGVDGTILWGTTFDSSYASSDAPWAMVLDGSGNVLVTGTSYTAPSVRDAYTLKLGGGDGAVMWERRFDGPAGKDDENYAIAIDGNNNAAVTGYSTNADNSLDIYTAKLAAGSGATLWEKRYNGPANKSDVPAAIAADPSGTAWVAGSSSSASNTAELVLLRYAPAEIGPSMSGGGGLSFMATQAPPSQTLNVMQGDTARFAAEFVDAEGNETVTFSAFSGGTPTGSFIKDNIGGTFEWSVGTGGTAPGDHLVTVTATDEGGASSSYSFNLRVIPLDVGQEWRRRFFGSIGDSGGAADDADPDQDGLSNLLEFAFALDPLRPSEGGPTVQGTSEGGTFSATANIGGGMQAIFRRRSDWQSSGLSYVVQFSPDLRNWVSSSAIPQVITEDEGVQQVSVPFPSPPPGGTANFFRVLVERTSR